MNHDNLACMHKDVGYSILVPLVSKSTNLCGWFIQVAERFVAAIDESIKPPLEMGFFINYNVDDILRQATESTLRYQRGTS
jgi:hypothetical protein